MSESVQVLPLPKVLPIWEHTGVSKYPETIKVSFSNGKVITYRIDVDMPHPCLEAAIRNIGNMQK